MDEDDWPVARSTTGRFVKGQSGNPGGRPRRSVKAAKAGPSAFDVIVDRALTITRAGVAREVTVEEALQHKTYQAALSGDWIAQRELLRMIAKREAALAKAREAPRPKVEVRTEAPPPRNVDDALVILGIAREDASGQPFPDRFRHLLLEPWAVQRALSRRRGGTALAKWQIKKIMSSTTDAESLRWPRGTRS